MKLSYFLIFIALSVHSVASAQTALAIPNSFTNGEIIDADKINQNFTGIETHINQNQGHKHLHIVDGNNIDLGAVFNFNGPNGNPEFISNKGYLAAIKTNPVEIGAFFVYFQSIDCTGQKFRVTPIIDDLTQFELMETRSLFWNELENKYYYADLQTAQVILTGLSRYQSNDSSACITLTVPEFPPVIPILENDPAITGVPNNIVFPVRLEYK